MYVVCPHCTKRVDIFVTLTTPEVPASMVAVGRAEPIKVIPLDPTARWLQSLSPSQRALLEEWRTAGLVDAFKTAIASMNIEQHPTVPEKFLLDWLHRGRVRHPVPPPWVRWASRTVGGVVQFVAYQGIYGLVSDGTLRGFVHASTLEAGLAKPIDRRVEPLARPNGAPTRDADWVRTRFGYAVAGGLLLEEMQKRYIGEFGR